MLGFASYLIQIQREPDVAVGSLCCEKKNINILDNIEIFCYKHTIKYLSFNLSHTKKNYGFEDCARFSFREEISAAVKLVFHFSGSTIRASSDEVRQKKSDKYITHKNTKTQIHKYTKHNTSLLCKPVQMTQRCGKKN